MEDCSTVRVQQLLAYGSKSGLLSYPPRIVARLREGYAEHDIDMAVTQSVNQSVCLSVCLSVGIVSKRLNISLKFVQFLVELNAFERLRRINGALNAF